MLCVAIVAGKRRIRDQIVYMFDYLYSQVYGPQIYSNNIILISLMWEPLCNANCLVGFRMTLLIGSLDNILLLRIAIF